MVYGRASFQKGVFPDSESGNVGRHKSLSGLELNSPSLNPPDHVLYSVAFPILTLPGDDPPMPMNRNDRLTVGQRLEVILNSHQDIYLAAQRRLTSIP